MYRLTTSFNSNATVDNTKSNEILTFNVQNVEDSLFHPNTDRMQFREQFFDPNMSFKICKSRVSFLGLKGLREGINGIPNNPNETEYNAAKIQFNGTHAGVFLNTSPHTPGILEIKKFNEWELQDFIIPARSYFDLSGFYPTFKLYVSSMVFCYDGIGIQTIYNGRSVIPFIELLIDDTKLILAG